MCATGVTRFDEVTLVFSRLQRERQLDEAALSFSYWKRMRRRHFGNICETFLSETDMKGRMYISCLCIKYSEGEPWLSSKAGSRGKHEAWLCSEIKKKVHQPKSLKLTKWQVASRLFILCTNRNVKKKKGDCMGELCVCLRYFLTNSSSSIWL